MAHSKCFELLCVAYQWDYMLMERTKASKGSVVVKLIFPAGNKIGQRRLTLRTCMPTIYSILKGSRVFVIRTVLAKV